MFNVVWEVLMQFITVWQTNLGLKQLADKLKANNDALSEIRAPADVKTNGITSDKETLKQDVVHSIMEVAGPLATAADLAGNMELVVKVTFSDSSLKDMMEAELADTGIQVAQLANENLVEIKKFGVTTEEITHLEEVSKTFKSNLPKGRKTVGIRVASKKTRNQIIRDNTQLLNKHMDGVIENYRRKSPEFWNAYFNVRKVVEYGTRHEKKPVVKKEEGK